MYLCSAVWQPRVCAVVVAAAGSSAYIPDLEESNVRPNERPDEELG